MRPENERYHQRPDSYFRLARVSQGVKSERDLAALTQDLLKITVETSLNAEMDDHLGYPKQSPEGYGSGNSRNGYGTKKLKRKSSTGDRECL